MAKKQDRSQLLDLFLHVADLLGATTDREIAELAGIGVDNIANWRAGTVKELKAQTLRTIKENLTARFATLREQLLQVEAALEHGLVPLEIEEGSGPTALQKQFVNRMVYDYLGHRFLYFEPQGALAWENLIGKGYEQDRWLALARECIDHWTDRHRDAAGCKGPIAAAVGWDRKGVRKGLDVISLGPGEGGKETIVLEQLLRAQRDGQRLSWLTLALVDVSIPLLLSATKSARAVAAQGDTLGRPPFTVLPFCADFEEGSLAFLRRLPSETAEANRAVRLVMMLGNVFGNVRDEGTFLRQKLLKMVRPGDFVWIDVAIGAESIEQDPLFRMTEPDQAATAAFSARRLLLEGPYRRWEAAIGRPPTEIETRVWLRRGDDTSRVPGSVNFCHDLIIKPERRVCTMLYSRRYEADGLTAWFEDRGLSVERIVRVDDSRPKVVHLLLRRR